MDVDPTHTVKELAPILFGAEFGLEILLEIEKLGFTTFHNFFLIGPHTPATLGCWPGSRVWTNREKIVKSCEVTESARVLLQHTW